MEELKQENMEDLEKISLDDDAIAQVMGGVCSEPLISSMMKNQFAN